MNEKNSQSIKSDRISLSSIYRAAGNIAAGMAADAYKSWFTNGLYWNWLWLRTKWRKARTL